MRSQSARLRKNEAFFLILVVANILFAEFRGSRPSINLKINNIYVMYFMTYHHIPELIEREMFKFVYGNLHRIRFMVSS